MDLEVETRLDDIDLREVRIIPSGVGYNVEIVYAKEKIVITYRDRLSRISFDLFKHLFE